MKVRSKTVYEATQITEGMIRGKERPPAGVVERYAMGGRSVLVYGAGSPDAQQVGEGDWIVPGALRSVFLDTEFREEFEEVEDGDR